jgi:diguanylate cyclase (GGDEF)-like protein
MSESVAGVAHDVGQHRSRIEQLSQELSAAQSSPEGRPAESLLHAVAEILQINARLQDRLLSAEEKLHQQARQVDSWMAAARTDPLTGLPNRRAFDAALARQIAQWRRNQGAFSVVLIDADHFKAVNDRHGHAAGDAVLRALAEMLERTFRKMDLVARIGGEEFAVLLPATAAAEACRAAENCRLAVAAHDFSWEDVELRLTVSLGIAVVDGDDDTAALLERADRAVYAAKHAGRNCAYLHTDRRCEPAAADASPPADEDSAAGPRDDRNEDAALAVACQRLRLRLAEVVGDDA